MSQGLRTLSSHTDLRVLVPTRRRATRKDVLVALVEDNPKISLASLVKALGVKKPTAMDYMEELDAEGRLPAGLIEAFNKLHRASIRRARRRRELQRRRTRKLSPEKRRKELLKMMRGDPRIAVKDLVRELNCSETTVKVVRAKLRAEGFITGKGRSLVVVASNASARKELRARRIIELLEDNPDLTRGAIADTLECSINQITDCVRMLRQRRDLPGDFRFNVKRSYEWLHRKMDARREKRKSIIVKGIAQNLPHIDIAYLAWVSPFVISNDIKSWLRHGDPEMIEAIRKRDEIRESLRKSKPRKKGVLLVETLARAEKELGVTLKELNTQNREWWANAGPDDSILREIPGR